MATFTTGPDGQMVVSQGPPLHLGYTQNNVAGGILEAASSKTVTSQAAQAEAAQHLGAGQKGAGRKSRRKSKKRRSSRKKKGGAAPNMNVSLTELPTANSIPGVSHETNHINAVNNLNQIRADSSYDSLLNATPRQVAGKRSRKAKNGSRHNRTHRRKRS